MSWWWDDVEDAADDGCCCDDDDGDTEDDDGCGGDDDNDNEDDVVCNGENDDGCGGDDNNDGCGDRGTESVVEADTVFIRSRFAAETTTRWLWPLSFCQLSLGSVAAAEELFFEGCLVLVLPQRSPLHISSKNNGLVSFA